MEEGDDEKGCDDRYIKNNRKRKKLLQDDQKGPRQDLRWTQATFSLNGHICGI